jgi:hypothetical protein
VHRLSRVLVAKCSRVVDAKYSRMADDRAGCWAALDLSWQLRWADDRAAWRHHAVAWVVAEQRQQQRQSAWWERREKRCPGPLDSLQAMVDRVDVCVLLWTVSQCGQSVVTIQVLSHLGVMALVCATRLCLSSLCALVRVPACLLWAVTVCHAPAPGNRRALSVAS